MNPILIRRLTSARRRQYSSSHLSARGTRDIASQYFLKAKNQQAEARHWQALDFYIKATIYDPNYFQAFCNMGSCYRSLGKYQESKNSYLRALKINPKDAISNYNIANLYRIISDYDQSISHYNFIINEQQNGGDISKELYVNSLINVGICYKNLGLYEKGISVYENVNKVAPDEQIGYYNHGMNILCLIQKNTVSKVNNFDIQLASKATLLFDKVLQINHTKKIVLLAKLKLRVLVDRSKQAVNKCLDELKSYEQECGFQQLGEQLGQTRNYILSFDKPQLDAVQFLASIFQPNTSIVNNKEIQTQKSLFSAFQQEQTNNYYDTAFLTQQQGMQMINDGRLPYLQTILSSMNDSPIKAVLSLATNLHKLHINNKYLDKAYQIYIKHFTHQQTHHSIPFQQISTTGHQLIGKLLNLKNQFKQAALHFQYSSSMLRRNAKSSAKVHNDIGQGLEAAGSMNQAIEEYLLAFELEPKNEKVAYNLGCCLFEAGRFDEALQYFNIFMRTLHDNKELNVTQTELWETECLILIALASAEQQHALKSYLLAYHRLKQLRKKAGEPQLEQQHLLAFFQNMATLLQEHFAAQNSQFTQQQLQQYLIEAYNQLLLFSKCQDRQAIAVNLGSLCYQTRRYLTAIQHWEQIKTAILIPYQKMALCYLRLIEPQMTIKYIELQQSVNKRSQRVHFIRDIIEWVYYNQNSGTYNKLLPQVREDLLEQRNQYAIALIDQFQSQLKQRKIQSSSKIMQLIDQLLARLPQVSLIQHNQDNKMDKIAAIMQRYPVKQPTHTTLNAQILSICFNSSQQVLHHLQQLLHYVANLPSQPYSTDIIQSLLHVFIYSNQKETPAIKQQLAKYAQSNIKVVSFNTDKVGSNEEYLCIRPDFDSLKKLVLLLRQWQQVLSPKIDQIIQITQQIYYSGSDVRCIVKEYHFPRHSNMNESDQTFYKLVHIVMKVLRMQLKLNIKGSNLPEIKKELISQFQYKFNHHLKSVKLKPIYLSQQFIPATLTTYHNTKADTEQFIHQLLTTASNTQLMPQDCDQYHLVINRIVRVRCKWGDPFSSRAICSTIISKILSNPLYIANQSVIALTKLLPALSMYSREALGFIKQDHSLQF